ncbi:MAG: Zn-ribbon domain-containing OB-fold protein [Dehalococcoidia bacterium]
MTTSTEYAKPLPVRTEENAPFWDSAKRHALEMQRCGNCGRFRYPVADFCPRCLSPEFEWQAVSGNATLYSYIIVHQRYDPSFADDLPYNVAVVELDEGPRLVSNIVGIPNGDIRVGMPLTITYEDVTDEFTLPKFKPA